MITIPYDKSHIVKEVRITSFLNAGWLAELFQCLAARGTDSYPFPGRSAVRCKNASEDDEARIIFGESIDNVEIGDNATAVRGKLGEPDEILRGDFAGKIFSYTQGKYNGIQMMIHDDDEKGVVIVSIFPPYSGTTREGIGIGTSRQR